MKPAVYTATDTATTCSSLSCSAPSLLPCASLWAPQARLLLRTLVGEAAVDEVDAIAANPACVEAGYVAGRGGDGGKVNHNQTTNQLNP